MYIHFTGSFRWDLPKEVRQKEDEEAKARIAEAKSENDDLLGKNKKYLQYRIAWPSITNGLKKSTFGMNNDTFRKGDQRKFIRVVSSSCDHATSFCTFIDLRGAKAFSRKKQGIRNGFEFDHTF
jgi:hypothetical protein